MGQTTFATSNALTKKLFDEKLFRDTLKESFFASRFMGEGPDNIVHVKTQLEKSQGDKITFGIRMRLSGAGQTSSGVLEGNEEALTTYDCSVSLEEYAHAVRDKGPLDRQRAMFSIDDESKDALKGWGVEKVDALNFAALLANPTKIVYKTSAGPLVTSTAATAKSALTAANGKLTLAMISYMKTLALGGQNRAFVPLRPIRFKSRNYFVLLTHPDCLYDLRASSDTPNITTLWQNARERSEDNPLFRDAEFVYDNVIVMSHENCTIADDAGAGSDVSWAKSVFMGAQALVWAWGKRPETVAATFDYDRSHGYAWSIIAGVAKPVFNSIDYGSFGVYLARTDIN